VHLTPFFGLGFLQGLLDSRGFVFVLPSFSLVLIITRVVRAFLQLYGEAAFFFGLFFDINFPKFSLVPFLIFSNFLEVSGDLSSSSIAFSFDKVSFFPVPTS